MLLSFESLIIDKLKAKVPSPILNQMKIFFLATHTTWPPYYPITIN